MSNEQSKEHVALELLKYSHSREAKFSSENRNDKPSFRITLEDYAKCLQVVNGDAVDEVYDPKPKGKMPTHYK